MNRIEVRNLLILKILRFSLFFLLCFIISCNQGKKQVNVLDFKRSAGNDTEMIQKAIDHAANQNIGVVYVPEGKYEIDAIKSLRLRDNIHLILADEAVLEALPNDKRNYAILALHDVSNVKISGGKIYGERVRHTGKGGEWGMGIDLKNTKNIEIEDISISDCWGDAIYIGKGTNEDVKINNVICDNNRRQGISVTRADGVTITNSTFINTNGTKPESGIDLEPNAGDIVKNIRIMNCVFEKNAWTGLNIFSKEGLVSHVYVESCTFTDNPDMGIQVGRGNTAEIEFRNIKIKGSDIAIKVKDGAQGIKFANIIVSDYTGNGVYVYNTDGRPFCRDIEFTNCTFQSARGKDAVLLSGVENVKFINNSFKGDLFFDDNIYSYIKFNGTSSNNTIIANTIEAGSGNNKARFGIRLGDSTRLIAISENQIAADAYTELAIIDKSSDNN